MDDYDEHEDCDHAEYTEVVVRTIAPIRLHWTDPIRGLVVLGQRVAEGVGELLEDWALDLTCHAKWVREQRAISERRAAAMIDMGLVPTTSEEDRR